MTQKLKFTIVAVIGLSILLSLSCVCASDIENTPTDPTTLNDTTAINNDYQPVTGNFEDLNNDIQNLQPGDTYNIDKDYYFNDDGKNIHPDNRVIIINKDNIKINGNGHIIDAGGSSQNFAIFQVTANNVKIFNLTFINSQPYETPNTIQINDKMDKTYILNPSPISWYGNNGVISGCTFENTKATLGGAISWRGNNGVITNCTFKNSTAQTIGGAIYVGGEHNTFIDDSFVNSRSLLTNEAIFTDCGRKDFTIVNGKFETCGKIIDDGARYKVDISNLAISVNSYVTDVKLDIVKILYSAMMNGGITYMDDGISYYAQYIDTNDIVLTISRDFYEYGITYKKDYIFNDIGQDFDHIFDLLYEGNYKNDITIIVNKTVNNEQDYNAAWKTTLFDSIYPIYDKFTPDLEGYLPLDDNKITTILNINFAKKLTFKNTNTWEFLCRDFDIININGNYSTIEGSYKSREEDKWAVLKDGDTFLASNLYIKGFNTAVENMGGTCIFTNVTFSNNKMDYVFDRDWGAAILNVGVIYCYNCKFIDNFAKNGGAIFNQGLLVLNDCYFNGNYAYGEGDHICIGKDGKVIIDGIESTEKNQYGPVHFAKSLDESTSEWITTGCYILSFLGGVVVGAITANPVAGALAGAALGAVLGSAAAAYVISNTFDVNFNRLETCLVLIVGSAAFGAIGGLIGGFITVAVPEIEAVQGQVLGQGVDAMSELSLESLEEEVIVDLAIN